MLTLDQNRALRGMLVEASLRRGLVGKEHLAALKKGFVDLGGVARAVSQEAIAKALREAMNQGTGVAYIRDPDDILGKAGVTTSVLGKALRDVYFEDWGESAYFGAAENPNAPWARAYNDAALAASKAQVSFTKIRGKDGAPGYRVVMSPAPEKILDAAIKAAGAKRGVF